MAQSCHRFRRKLTVAAALVLALTSFMVPSDALAYDCTGPLCAGSVVWDGGVSGADARIRVGNMSSTNSNSDWHINNALWLRDSGGVNDCWVAGGWYDVAWVEVGYIGRANAYGFYWGDCRPGASYYEKYLGSVYSEDKGRNNFFEINRIDSGSFRVFIEAGRYDYSTSSYVNTMSPDQIEIGMELIGDSGAYADTTSFNNNRYIQGSGRYYQFRDGDRKWQAGPPQSWWYVHPASSSSGGDWRTYCGC